MSNSSKLQNMLEIPATLAIDSLGEYCRHPSSINRFFGILCLDAYCDICVSFQNFRYYEEFMGLMLF